MDTSSSKTSASGDPAAPAPAPAPVVAKPASAPDDGESLSLDLIRPTLHAAGIKTAGMTDPQIRQAYHEHVAARDNPAAQQERAEKARAAELTRAAQAMKQDADDRRRRDESAARRVLGEAGVSPEGLEGEALIERARQVHAEQREKETRERRREHAKRLYDAAGVPKRHALHLATIDDAQSPEFARVRDLLTARLPDGYLVSLIGKRGTGKTQVAVATIREACKRQLSARYFKRLDLSRLIRSTFSRPSNKGASAGPSENDLIEELAAVGLLVVDEIHQTGDSDFDKNLLINLLDRRYDAMLPSILIGNATKEQFAGLVGDSVVSRLNETGEIIEFNGASFRQPGMWNQNEGGNAA